MPEDRKEKLEEMMAKIFACRKTELPAFNKHGLLDLDHTTATVDDIVRCQKDGADLAARDENGATPLHHAAR